MGPDLPAAVLAFLAEQQVMTLATHGADGPWAAAVFYAESGTDLIFVSSPGSRHAGQLALDPRCAAAIHGPAADWASIRGIQLEGRVQALQGDARARAQTLYGEKFPFARPAVAAATLLQALARVHWYRLRIERLFLIDNARGFGRRQVFEPE